MPTNTLSDATLTLGGFLRGPAAAADVHAVERLLALTAEAA